MEYFLSWLKSFVRLHPDGSFRQKLFSWKFLITVVVLHFISSPVSNSWSIQYAGLHSEDVFRREIKPKPAQYTSIVAIDPGYYDKHLNGESIRPCELLKMLNRLLEWEPAVIVVDLDTSATKFTNFHRSKLTNPRNIPIIWARDADEVGNGDGAELKSQRVLGSDSVSSLMWGYPLFRETPDWTVREYDRTLRVDRRTQSTLYWAAANEFCHTSLATMVAECGHVRALADRESRLPELKTPVALARYQIPITPVEDLMTNDGSKNNEPKKEHDLRNEASEPEAPTPLRHKIMLLGGTYSSTERHATPWGLLSGVVLLGNAVEAELNPQRGREASEWEKYGFEAVLAIVALAVNYWLKPIPAMLTMILVVGGLVFFGSFLALWFTGYRASFVPFIVGMWIAQLWDSAREAQELNQKLDRELQSGKQRGS